MESIIKECQSRLQRSLDNEEILKNDIEKYKLKADKYKRKAFEYRKEKNEIIEQSENMNVNVNMNGSKENCQRCNKAYQLDKDLTPAFG